MVSQMVNVIYILAERGKAGGPQKLGEPILMALDASGGEKVFLVFLV